MVENLVLDFMITRIKIFAAVLALVFVSCERTNNHPSNIPNVPVNITINLNLPLYQNLNIPGNFIYENGGFKGIIVMHGPDGQFRAFERACTYEPDRVCSIVEMDTQASRIHCGQMVSGSFEKCCDSRFTQFGTVTQGPALYPLKQYFIERNGGFLNIRN
jgi:hypothetical protein